MFSLFQNPENATTSEAFKTNTDMLLQLVVGCFSAEYYKQLSLVKFLDPSNLVIVNEPFELDIVVGKYQLRHKSNKSLRLKTFFKPEKLKNDDDNVLKIAEMFNITLPVGFTKGYGSLSLLFYYQFIVMNEDYMTKVSSVPGNAYEFLQPIKNPKERDFSVKEYGEKAFDFMGFIREAPKLSDIESTINKLNIALKSLKWDKNADGTILEGFYSVRAFEASNSRDGIDTINGTFYVQTETSSGFFSSTTSITKNSYNKALYYLRAAYQYEFDGQLPRDDVTDYGAWLLNPTFKMVTAKDYERRFNDALSKSDFEKATTEALDFSKRKFDNRDQFELVNKLKDAEIAFARYATNLNDMQRMIDVSRELKDVKHTQTLEDILKNANDADNLLGTYKKGGDINILKQLEDLKGTSKYAALRFEEAQKLPKAPEPSKPSEIPEPPSSGVPETPEPPETTATPESEISEPPETPEPPSSGVPKTPEPSKPEVSGPPSSSAPEVLSELNTIENDKTLNAPYVVKQFNDFLKKMPDVPKKPKEVVAVFNNGQVQSADKLIEKGPNTGKWFLKTKDKFSMVNEDSKKELIRHLRELYGTTTAETPSSGVPETSKPTSSVLFEPFSDVKIDNLQQRMDAINKEAKLDNSAVSQARLQAAVVFQEKKKKDRKALVFSQLKL